MRFSRILLLATTSIASLSCETAAPAQAPAFAERLQSKTARTVAWAAHDITNWGVRTQTRHLVSSLQAWGARNGEEADVVRLHLLDALVQTGAKVPGSLVLPHIRGITEVPAFVLLGRDPRQNETELCSYFFSQPTTVIHSIAWWAAGNLLCAQKAPGFGAWVLEQTRFELEIDVVLPGGPLYARCGGAIGLDPGKEPHRQLRDFPPVPVYSFKVGRSDPWDKPEPLGRNVLAPGQAPVGFRRELRRGNYCAGTSSYNRTDWLVVGWLEEIAPSCNPWGTRIEVVEFTTAAAFVDRVQDLRRQFVQNQRDLVKSLVACGAMTTIEAAAFTVHSDFKMCDWRTEAKDQLPDVPKELDHATATSVAAHSPR